MKTLRVPEEIGAIISHGAFPQDRENPVVVLEFIGGYESLFDIRKGLFLNAPAGIPLPQREVLKAFGKLIQSFRQISGDRHCDEPEIEQFEICC